MTYPEAIQFLHGLQMFGAKPGLEATLKLAELCGNPQNSLRFIHVAGTNGKGSTCAMLESIYRKSGLRVGLYTSPHLVQFGERIQVNRQLISDADLTRLVEGMIPLLKEFSKADHPTFFEVATIMALNYFAVKRCDLVIWETGLGGRLDATNIVTPLASVITNIQFDHQAWLGGTLERIAREKAGIIKPGVPVITAVEDAAAKNVIHEIALEKSAPFKLVTWKSTETPPLAGILLSLRGDHQRMNAALAVATVELLRGSISVTDKQIAQGLTDVRWLGRLQSVNLSGGRRVLLDGAHNIAGAESLRDALRHELSGRSITLILGILSDKDCAEICGILSPLASRIILAPVKSSRSASPADLFAMCRKANAHAEIIRADSLEQAIETAWPRHSMTLTGESNKPSQTAPKSADSLVVIAGSLYLIGEAMELLNLAPHTHSEASLNEWGGKPAGNTKQ